MNNRIPVPIKLRNGRIVIPYVPADEGKVVYRHQVSLPMIHWYDEYGNYHEKPDFSRPLLVYGDEYEIV